MIRSPSLSAMSLPTGLRMVPQGFCSIGSFGTLPSFVFRVTCIHTNTNASQQRTNCVLKDFPEESFMIQGNNPGRLKGCVTKAANEPSEVLDILLRDIFAVSPIRAPLELILKANSRATPADNAEETFGFTLGSLFSNTKLW